MERMEVTETFAGIALPGHLHTQESLGFAAAFTFRPTDVLIATYPKSGEGPRGQRGDAAGQGWHLGLERGLFWSCRRGWEVAGLGDTRTWSPRPLFGTARGPWPGRPAP